MSVLIPRGRWLSTIQKEEITTDNLVILTGTCRDGDWLPIPSGFREDQCRFFVSPADTMNEYWDLDYEERGTRPGHRYVCRLLNNRKVDMYVMIPYCDAGTRHADDTSASHLGRNNWRVFRYGKMIANYLVIAKR